MADLLSPLQVKAYKEVFLHFDKENKGHIQTKDLAPLTKNFGFKLSEQELKDMISQVITKEDQISFDDFLLLMARQTCNESMLKKAKDAFQVFDPSNKGSLDKNQLETILQNLGENLKPNEIQDLLSDLNELNPQNELDYCNFLKNLISK